MQTYVFKIAPEYTTATYYNGYDFITLSEWSGRTLDEVKANMKSRERDGWQYRVETYTLSGGRMIEEHTWTK